MILSVRCFHKFLLPCLILLSLSNLGGYYIKKEIDTSKEGRPEESEKVETYTPTQIIVPGPTQFTREVQPLREFQFLQETQSIKDEIAKLRKELVDQKDITSMLLDKVNDLTNNQSQFSSQLRDNTNQLSNIGSDLNFFRQQLIFMDTFIFNKEGKPYAYIDPAFKIYEYKSGNLIGFLDSTSNQVIRNFDGSTVAILSGSFLFDETGHPLASIDMSENLRWEREKLYPQIQKTPISHIFTSLQNKRQFIQSPYIFTDWSNQKLEEVLFFDEKNVEKVK